MPRSNATRVAHTTRRPFTLSALGAMFIAAAAAAVPAQAQTEPLLVVASGSSMVNFGNQPINTTTAPKAVLLQNAGTAGLSVASVTLTGTNPGDFILANNGCSTLAPGGTCSITVQFKPATANSRSARLRIVDNASGSPHLIPLVGNGIDPTVRPKVIGPIDARTGYPASITDQNGVTLGLCWDDPNLCLTTLPDPTAPPAVRDDVVNFPDESFWYSLEAEIDPWPFGQRALLVIAQEAAFVGDMVPGGQAMFGRVRIRVDGLQPLTTYRFTHPYGRDLITTDEDGQIFSTEDIGCLSTPCDYTLATTSRVWPFLKWDPNVAPAAPTGYLGDFNVLHPVVGSPIGQNVFRIEQVNGSNFQLIGETNLFALSGKIVGAPTAPPPVGTVIVPDVVQQLQADAQGNISGAGLAVGAITTATSPTVFAGRVISQSPAAGASVAAGSAVSFVVSIGPSLVTVPNVVGQAQAVAQGNVAAAGLTNGAVTTTNHATIPAGQVISQSPASGSSVVPGSVVTLVVSLGPSLVPVPNVVGQTQAAAQGSVTAAGLTNGAVSSVNHATVPAGQVISQSPVAGTSVLPGAAVSLVVSLGPASTSQPPSPMATVFADGTGARTVTLSTTAPNAVLVALAASDGPTTGANNQNLTIAGGGLTWTRVQRVAVQRGVAEIWTATAPAVLTNASITSTQSVTTVLGAPVNQSLTVIAFANASGVGASNTANGATGAPRVTLVTQGDGSAIYGVGIDFDRAVARTVPAGQTKVHEFLAPSGDTMWMQSLNATTAPAGSTVTLNDTAPANDQWNFAIVEIRR